MQLFVKARAALVPGSTLHAEGTVYFDAPTSYIAWAGTVHALGDGIDVAAAASQDAEVMAPGSM